MIWDQLVVQIEANPEKTNNVFVLRGFLKALRVKYQGLVNGFLEESVTKNPLARWYLLLETAGVIDERGVARLMRSLEVAMVSAPDYRYLAWGDAAATIPTANFGKLLFAISSTAEGFETAVGILWARLRALKDEELVTDPELLAVGRELLRHVAFSKKNPPADHLGGICRLFLAGKQGEDTARDICRKLRSAVSGYNTHPHYHGRLLESLLKAQPHAVLDEILTEDSANSGSGLRIIEEMKRNRKNPLDAVADSDLLGWCDIEAVRRYPLAAEAITIPIRLPDHGARQWTSVALRLLDRAPDKLAVLGVFVDRMTPRSWSDSRSKVMESGLMLLGELDEYLDSSAKAFLAQEKGRLSEAIDEERRTETRLYRNRDERFE
jgi:hypothetical protein